MTCDVPVATLQTAPFSLPYGSSIYAKVTAYNVYGDSQTSDEGNGAVIYTYADAPVDLVEDVSARTASSITFSWTEGPSNGGNTVIDYRVSYDQATGTWTSLANEHTEKVYTASGLSPGLTYSFKVEARNEFGFSEYSDTVQILCAMHPETPDAPSTTVVGDSVVFEWAAPADNGTPITAYSVYIRQSDLTYIEDLTICDGSDLTVITNTQCTVPLASLRAEPYNLLVGNKIYIKVVATNAYGSSLISDSGSTDGMEKEPDAPVAIQNDPFVTTDA